MPFNVLLLPLMGGYIFITNWNRTRFATRRHSGERLLFGAASAGLLFLVVAFVIVRIIAEARPEWRMVWKTHVQFPYAGTSLIAFLLGLVAWWPLNLFYKAETHSRRAVEQWGDHLEVMFNRALGTKQVALTLKNGKVYIGVLLSTFDPTYDRKYISILPFVSGYREPITNNLKLTTWYERVYQEIQNGTDSSVLAPQDFQIIIPVGELLTANIFDWDAYNLFQRHAAGEIPPEEPFAPDQTTFDDSHERPSGDVPGGS